MLLQQGKQQKKKKKKTQKLNKKRKRGVESDSSDGGLLDETDENYGSQSSESEDGDTEDEDSMFSSQNDDSIRVVLNAFEWDEDVPLLVKPRADTYGMYGSLYYKQAYEEYGPSSLSGSTTTRGVS